MAEEDDTSDKTEDPTQKRLDEALERGDVVKSQELNTWFVIAGATLVLSNFSGWIGDRITMPLRNLIAKSWEIPTDGPGLIALARSATAAGDRRDRRQYGAAPDRVFWRTPEAEIVKDFASFRVQADLRQTGGGEFRQRPV